MNQSLSRRGLVPGPSSKGSAVAFHGAAADPVSFFVPSRPVPQGNHTPVQTRRGLRVRETSKGHAAWRATVAVYGRSAMRGRDPIAAPVELGATFYLPCPARIPPERRGYPSTRPDLSKLIRAIEDSLTGIVIVDDSLIVTTLARKRYARPHSEPGVRITIAPALDDVWGDR